MIEVNGRIAGGGLVLSVDAGQRAVPVDIVPVESALRPDERSARYRHNGAVIWLTGLPGSGKSTLARALERRLFSRGGSPILLDGDTLARRPQRRSRLLRRRTAPKTFAGSPKSRPIWRATDTSPSSPRCRRRRKIAPPRAASPTRRSAKSMSRRRPRSAKAAIRRATTPRRAPARCRRSPGSATITSRRPGAELTHRHLGQDGFGCDRRDRADAGGNRHSVRRTGRSGGQYLSATPVGRRPK